MTKVTFYLIRHGATALNAENGGTDRIRGHDDVPLSATGRKEAKKLADQLADSGIKKIACSDLSRACDTANDIAKATSAKVIRESDLRPWDVGKFTGKESAIAGPQIKSYAENKPHQKIPGGESFETFRRRAMRGLIEAFDKDADAIVTHHRVERLIKSWVAQGEQPDGELCWRTFGKRGEKTAHSEKLTLDLAALRKAAETKWPEQGVAG